MKFVHLKQPFEIIKFIMLKSKCADDTSPFIVVNNNNEKANVLNNDP